MSDSPNVRATTTVGGHVNLHDSHFIGRDYNHVEVSFSGAELQTLLTELLPLLRRADVRVVDGEIAAQGQTLTVNSAQAEASALRTVCAAPHPTPEGSPKFFVTMLCVVMHYGRAASYVLSLATTKSSLAPGAQQFAHLVQ